jgi:hypothetical protein
VSVALLILINKRLHWQLRPDCQDETPDEVFWVSVVYYLAHSQRSILWIDLLDTAVNVLDHVVGIMIMGEIRR